MYVAVQGQQQSNKFKLSMWDALFAQDTYVTNVTEEQSAPVTVLDKNLTPYSYKYACLLMLWQFDNHAASGYFIRIGTGTMSW